MPKTFTLTLLAVAACGLAIAAAMTSAASVRSRSMPQATESVRPMFFHLFNRRDQREQLRKIYENQKPWYVLPASQASSSISSSAQSAQSSGVSSASERPMRIEDLTSAQLATLRMQLRIGGCPNGTVSRGYQLLCESMLRKQKHAAPIVIPKNPYQP